jgi:hypothetical protein
MVCHVNALISLNSIRDSRQMTLSIFLGYNYYIKITHTFSTPTAAELQFSVSQKSRNPKIIY